MGQPVVHFEISCRDQKKTADFFSRLFNWKIETAGHRAKIQTCGAGGIQGHITSLGHEPHHYVTFYVQVDDVQVYLD